MPTSEDSKKTGSAARAEAAQDSNFVSQDTFENPSIKALANTATVTDGFGIERIVGVGAGADFTPAPTEATPEQIEAAKKFEKTLADAKDQRTQLLAGSAKNAEEGAKKATQASDVKSEDRAPNHPGIGGSQATGDAAKDSQETKLGGGTEVKGTGNEKGGK